MSELKSELDFLRDTEQRVQRILAYHRGIKYSELACELAELREAVNQRIVEKLKADIAVQAKGKIQCPETTLAEGPGGQYWTRCVLNVGHDSRCAFSVEEVQALEDERRANDEAHEVFCAVNDPMNPETPPQ